jgi:glyoxylase-like metal-dependent hydrolase (beta-lactamase superfamily II)
VRIGDVEAIPLWDGRFRLDGGAMFGVVPKVLWARRAPADAKNRIALGLRPLLVKTPTQRILIDAGAGDKYLPKELEIYAFDRRDQLEASLAAAGVAPADIDIVIATHLHWDHVGGLTRRIDGRIVPRFPRARHLVRRGEWDVATHPNERNHASYVAEDFVPLAEAGLVDFIDVDGEVAAGVSVWRTGGHTAHHQVVRIESAGRVAIFAADLVPTVAHADAPWIMGYDLYPLETLAAKKRWLAEAAAGEYVIFFEHDPAIEAGIIRLERGRARVEPLPGDLSGPGVPDQL